MGQLMVPQKMQCCHQVQELSNENRFNTSPDFCCTEQETEDMPWVEVESYFDVGHQGEQGLVCCKVRSTDDIAGSPTDAEIAPHNTCGSGMSPRPLESLSYVPLRFDETATLDVERSQARYSKIACHNTGARTQRVSKTREDWLRTAILGRYITLLENISGEAAEDPSLQRYTRVPATYFIDRTLTKMTIVSQPVPCVGSKEVVAPDPITVPLDRIQVICSATDLAMLLDQVDTRLDASEQLRVVLVQYTDEDESKLRRRVCFLEESEKDKDRFIQALTGLWLEKRNDHSMWF